MNAISYVLLLLVFAMAVLVVGLNHNEKKKKKNCQQDKESDCSGCSLHEMCKK